MALTLYEKIALQGILTILLVFTVIKTFVFYASSSTTGQVIIVTEWQEFNLRFPYPIVEYSVDGRKYKFDGDRDIFFKRYRIGERVRVIYRKKNPEISSLDGFFNFWFPFQQSVILSLISLFWLGLFIVIQEGLLENRRQKEYF